MSKKKLHLDWSENSAALTNKKKKLEVTASKLECKETNM